MPKFGQESESITENSEVYDEGVCFLCKKPLKGTPDDIMCVGCHRYCHLGCTDLKGHPRLTSLVSTKALEFRISKDPDIRRRMENITVSHIGKLALFKYHCPTCRKKLSRARQYDESQCRTLFNTLIELINKSDVLQPRVIEREKLSNLSKTVKLEPCDNVLRKQALSTEKGCSRSRVTLNSTKESKVQPAVAPSRAPLNKKRLQSPENVHHISSDTSDTSSSISEISSVSSDNFQPSEMSLETETDDDYLQSIDTDHDQQDDKQESHLTNMQASSHSRGLSRRSSHLTNSKNSTTINTTKSRTQKLNTTRKQFSKTTINGYKKNLHVDEETLKLINIKKSQFNDPEYQFKHCFQRIFQQFKMSRVYKVAGNLYKKIYFNDAKDIYHFHTTSLIKKIKDVEAQSASLFSQLSMYTRHDFENLYSRLKRTEPRIERFATMKGTHSHLLEDSDEKHDSDTFIFTCIKYAEALGRYLLIKKFYITQSNFNVNNLKNLDFKRLLYPRNTTYTVPLIQYSNISFLPIEFQFLNNFHSYFNTITTEDMLSNIENSTTQLTLKVDYDKSSAMARIFSADFLCDTIIAPNQIADNQFFIFAIRSTSLLNASLLFQYPSVCFGKNKKTKLSN